MRNTHFLTPEMIAWYKSNVRHGSTRLVAEYLGKGVQTVSAYLHGRAAIPLEDAIRLCVLFDKFKVEDIYPEIAGSLKIIVQREVAAQLEALKASENDSEDNINE